MNKIVFLNRKFQYKDVVVIEENVSVVDIISTQKITIQIPFKLKIDESDFALFYKNGKIDFIGIIDSIENSTSNDILILNIVYVDEIFNLSCEFNSLSGNVFNWVKETIENNFVNTDDIVLNIPITIKNSLLKLYTGEYAFESNNLKNELSNLFKYNGTYLEYSLDVDSSGKPIGLIIDVKNNNDYEALNLKYNLPIIQNLKRVFTQNQNINKLILAPGEGVTGEKYVFYLLKDGTITRDANAVNRFPVVNQTIKFYDSEATAESLVTIAEQTLQGEEANHNIEFSLLKNDSFKLNLYQKINFIDKDANYNSYITKIINNGDIQTVTIGIVRKSLTDKLKKSSTSTGTTSVSSGGGGVSTKAKWGDISGEISDQTDLMGELAKRVPNERRVNDKPLTDDIELTADDVEAIPISQRGTANGVATLGADGKIISEQLPAIAIVDTYVVKSQTEMLALSAQQGDVAVRTDIHKNFILKNNIPTILSNWVELLVPPDVVLSVAGKTGNITLYIADIDGLETRLVSIETNINQHKANYENPHKVTKSQVGLNNVDNTSDKDKPVSDATLLALNNKLDKNQGSSNSGKILQVNSTGEVKPVEPMDSGVVPIVDNLETGDANSVLSANMGYLLNRLKATNVIDFNSVRTSYFYNKNNQNEYSNAMALDGVDIGNDTVAVIMYNSSSVFRTLIAIGKNESDAMNYRWRFEFDDLSKFQYISTYGMLVNDKNFSLAFNKKHNELYFTNGGNFVGAYFSGFLGFQPDGGGSNSNANYQCVATDGVDNLYFFNNTNHKLWNVNLKSGEEKSYQLPSSAVVKRIRCLNGMVLILTNLGLYYGTTFDNLILNENSIYQNAKDINFTNGIYAIAVDGLSSRYTTDLVNLYEPNNSNTISISKILTLGNEFVYIKDPNNGTYSETKNGISAVGLPPYKLYAPDNDLLKYAYSGFVCENGQLFLFNRTITSISYTEAMPLDVYLNNLIFSLNYKFVDFETNQTINGVKTINNVFKIKQWNINQASDGTLEFSKE